MPKLPTAEQLGSRPTPSPRGGISNLQLDVPRLGHEEAAMAELGQSVSNLGRTMAALAAREKQKNDGARTEEATNTYLNGLLELEMGETDGYMNVKTGDAVKRPLMDEYGKKRSSLKEKLRTELGNSEQQYAFDQRAMVADRQFDSRLYKHVADESRNYRNLIHEGIMQTEQKAAALYWQQPGQIELSMLRVNQAVLRKAKSEGLDPEREEDRAIINAMGSEAENQIHTGVIAQMLSQGQDAAASAYFNQIKERMTAEAVTTVSTKINAASIEGESIRAADTVWEVLGPTDVNSPIRLDVMETWVRDQYSENPTVVKQIIADLRSRAVAHNDGQREFDASNKAAVLGKFNEGATLKEIQGMPEYLDMDGESRAQVRDYIVNRGWTDQQRARATREYAEGDKSKAGFRSYWELSNPAVLSVLSEAQILALEPEMGQALVEQLMVKRRALDTPAKVQDASIDADTFNIIAAEAGLNPYAKTASPEQKEYLGRLRHRVESAIDEVQRASGRKLSREEKEVLMRRETDRKVLIDKWGSDPTMPAAAIRPDQRSKTYVNANDIDPIWMHEAINYMRSVGVISMELDDKKARVRMRDRLQRAYAHSLTGGSSAEGKAILEGKDQ